MILGVDIDGVLLDFHTPCVAFLNAYFGKQVALRDIKQYDMWHAYQVSEEEFKKGVQAFFKMPAFSELRPLPGAVKGVRRLAKQYDLVVLTSRSPDLASITETNLHRYFDGCFQDIHHTTGNMWDVTSSRKGRFCRELGVACLLEDCVAYAKAALQEGIAVVLYKRPWNQYEQLPPFVRRTTWSKMERAIKRTLIRMNGLDHKLL
ncbi:hypothetical protein HYS50_00045 [Candidatus Woesearchaeota archaeon]|nr:hypothetical protein [Candidatus Woesearchaeota archaeon]